MSTKLKIKLNISNKCLNLIYEDIKKQFGIVNAEYPDDMMNFDYLNSSLGIPNYNLGKIASDFKELVK